MEAIGYLYSLAAQDSDDAKITPQDNIDALNGAIAPLTQELTQDMAQTLGQASRQALTLACSASIVLAASGAAMALQRGDSGGTVTQLQEDLAAAGAYSGPVTGFYGSLTQAAVEDFQVARGLAVDGVAGPNTLAALRGAAPTPAAAAPNPNVLRRGNQGEAVSDLQRALANAGYFSGPVTGYYGSLTEAAVIGFQQAAGLVADGIAGPITLAELAVDNSTNVALVPVAQTVVTTVQPAAAATTTPLPAATGDVLYMGDRGQAVLSLQTTLADIGYYNKKRLTGYYGSSTEAAVKRFQESADLVVNGIAGPLTLEKLQERAATR